jgi:ankyrin repeat domain-containing protein 50
MLSKIDAASIEYARQILMWLCFAKRPLTVREVIDGVIVEPGDNPRVNLKRRLQDGDDILHICPGFIDVETSPDRTPRTYTQNNMARRVRITHYSVQEYLESDRIRQQTAAIFGMQSTTSNLEAAQICLVYLLDTTLSESKLTAAKLDKFPFADYAAKNWYEHYKSGDGEGSPVDLLIMQLFGGQQVAFQNWIKIHDPDRHYSIYDFERDSDDIASPVYYASLLGLRHVLCGLLETKREGDAQTSKSQELSSSGVSSLVNAQGGEYGNALQAASLRGHEKIVQLLLDKGAEVNAQRGYLGNALQAASLGGHENIVQLLLDKGAAVNAQGGEYGNALQAASIECREKVVQLLLDKGAAVNAQGGRYGNTLQAASEAGHEKIVQLLLNNGAGVNAQGGRYGNALYAASVGGHEHVVQLLLDKGAAVNANGGSYGNALQAASIGGHEKVVWLLLNEAAAVNAQGGRYGNALQAASLGGHEKIVQVLLLKGAEVNAHGGYFDNALQAASFGGHEKIVQILLLKGAEVNAHGGYFSSALQAASVRGHEKVVQLLLDEGAKVNAQGGEYGSALQAASAGGHEDIVELLEKAKLLQIGCSSA